MEIGLIDFQECNNMKNMLHDCKAGYISRPICAIITVKNMQSTSESLSVPFLKISKLITLSKTLDPDSLFLKVRVEILYEISSFFQQFTKKKKKIYQRVWWNEIIYTYIYSIFTFISCKICFIF